jgi:hypothetical protein
MDTIPFGQREDWHPTAEKLAEILTIYMYSFMPE